MSDEESTDQSLIYYPNPPIPLEKGFTDIIINELNFIEPFAPPIFEPLNSDEENEFEEILKNIAGEVHIPKCQRPHTPPEFSYKNKQHLDGYPVEYETLENNSPGFHVDSLLGKIGNVKHDTNIHKLYRVDDSDSDSNSDEIDEELQKKAESEAKRRADEMEEREAKARAEEALRKAGEAKKKAEEAKRIAEEARKKQEEEEKRLRKEEEERRKQRAERRKKREEEKRRKEEEEKKKIKEQPKPKPTSPENLPPVLRNRFKNLNIINPGGAPTTLGHMKRIIQENKSNEATVNRPQAS